MTAWTDPDGQKHHDMGTCHCGAHHALEGERNLRDRAVAAEAALAEVRKENREYEAQAIRDYQRINQTEVKLAEANETIRGGNCIRNESGVSPCEEANQQARDLADALEGVKHQLGHVTQTPAEAAAAALAIARAALDRHTQANT